MAIKLSERILALPMTQFSFQSWEKKVTTNSDGERVTYLVFGLVDPIEKVTGSNTSYDPNDGNRRLHLFQGDVIDVSCNVEMLDKYESEFHFDEEKGELAQTGNYKGNLLLDVSRSGEVWLTDVKFSKLGADWKKQKRSEEFMNLVKRIEEKGQK